VPLRLFQLEVAPMAALAQPTGAPTVRAGRGIRPIFQAVNKGIKGTDRRRFEGRKASDLCEARRGAEVMRPLRETFVVQQEHQEEGPEYADGVVGRPSSRARGIERAQEGAGGVQIETQEHAHGFVPGPGEATGLAAPPAVELGR